MVILILALFHIAYQKNWNKDVPWLSKSLITSNQKSKRANLRITKRFFGDRFIIEIVTCSGQTVQWFVESSGNNPIYWGKILIKVILSYEFWIFAMFTCSLHGQIEKKSLFEDYTIGSNLSQCWSPTILILKKAPCYCWNYDLGHPQKGSFNDIETYH